MHSIIKNLYDNGRIHLEYHIVFGIQYEVLMGNIAMEFQTMSLM